MAAWRLPTPSASGGTRLALTRDQARVQEALQRLGLCYHDRKYGTIERVNFLDARLLPDGGYGLLYVDPRLPFRVKAQQLTDPRTLEHLSRVVGYPVHLFEDERLPMAIVYAIEYRPHKPAVQALPESVSLDLAARPRSLGTYAFPVGVDGYGPVWTSLAGRHHTLVGGSTRSGKSTWLHAMALSLLQDNSPQRLRLVIIDPKRIEFPQYGNLPHLAYPVAWSLEEAKAALACVLTEVEARQAPFMAVGARSLEEYNNDPAVKEPLPYWLVCVDEFIELAVIEQSLRQGEFQALLVRLCTLAGAFGVKLALSCTYPKSEYVNTAVRENCGLRVCFHVLKALLRGLILGEYDEPPAKTPPIPGRCVVRMEDRLFPVQGYWVSKEFLYAQLRQWGPLPTIADFQRRLQAAPPLLLNVAELQAETADEPEVIALDGNGSGIVSRKEFTPADVAEAAEFLDARPRREGINALQAMWRHSGRTLGTPAAYRLRDLAVQYLERQENNASGN